MFLDSTGKTEAYLLYIYVHNSRGHFTSVVTFKEVFRLFELKLRKLSGI